MLIAGAMLLLAAVDPDGIPGFGPAPDRPSAILAQEEEMVYEVSYAFITLGTIRLKARPDLSADAWIDSREGLPFVDLHSRYHTQMDSMLYSRGAWSLDRQDDGTWTGWLYEYDQDQRRVMVERTRHHDPASPPFDRTRRDTLALPRAHFVDGLSIAYLPRALVRASRGVEIATVLMGAAGETAFYLPAEKTTVDLDAVEYPVKALAVEGTTGAVGIYGMSGDFKGWFSDDAYAVPLCGKLNVLIGSVNVELVQWKKSNWTPPR